MRCGPSVSIGRCRRGGGTSGASFNRRNDLPHQDFGASGYADRDTAIHLGGAFGSNLIGFVGEQGLAFADRVPVFHQPSGEQAASVLATVKRDGLEAKGGAWSMEEEEAFKAPIRRQYEEQGHPYFATARLWDDGIIDPADTRRVLALGLAAALNAPIPDTRFGVFRM